MMRPSALVGPLLATFLLGSIIGCTPDKAKAAEGAGLVAFDGGAPGIQPTNDGWIFRTEPFTVPASKEKFLCYAVTAKEKMTISRFSSNAHRVIHHFLFSEAIVHEPEGMSECDVIFKGTWAPMYIATTATASITMPEGSARTVEPDGQLVLQLHLVNTTSDDITDTAEVHMERSDLADPEPAGVFAFGTTDVSLPAKTVTTVESMCTVTSDVHLFAMLPHMHYLGKKLDFAAGPDAAHLTPLFTRDPYSFDDQKIDNLDHVIPAGSVTRTRCTFDNDRNEVVRFGESSFDEMCFGIGFEIGGATTLGTCITRRPPPDGGVPRAADAGTCGETASANGVGRPCTKTGNECDQGMFCTAGVADAGRGVCISIGCSSNSDCGGSGNTCCAPPQGAGVVNICVPEACRSTDCIPVGR